VRPELVETTERYLIQLVQSGRLRGQITISLITGLRSTWLE